MDGNEIMEMFGIGQGKLLGDIMRALKEDKVANSGQTKEQAIKIAEEVLEQNK